MDIVQCPQVRDLAAVEGVRGGRGGREVLLGGDVVECGIDSVGVGADVADRDDESALCCLQARPGDALPGLRFIQGCENQERQRICK